MIVTILAYKRDILGVRNFEQGPTQWDMGRLNLNQVFPHIQSYLNQLDDLKSKDLSKINHILTKTRVLRSTRDRWSQSSRPEILSSTQERGQCVGIDLKIKRAQNMENIILKGDHLRIVVTILGTTRWGPKMCHPRMREICRLFLLRFQTPSSQALQAT